MYVFILILWYLLGIFSFIYCWTEDDDFTRNSIPLALVCGIVGPTWFVYMFFNNEKVLISRRKK